MSIPRPTGSMMAVVAVLLTAREIVAVTTPMASRSRAGLRVAQPRPSTANAKRRSSPLDRIASASMKLPMNRKITGSPYELKTVRAEATPSVTASSDESIAVTGIGMASVIQ
ncbi:MAG: hypothetical protein FJ037_03985 [Chloroflexi bacterium]|nr:hypothetical protein [Chloroflexota bacterium]